MKRVLMNGMLVVLLVLLPSCGIGKLITETVDPIVNKTIESFDYAIESLNLASADWQKVLEELEADLIEQGQSTLRNEVADVLQRSVAAVGVEARCEVDFLRKRISQTLRSIIDSFLGKDTPPPPPTFCQWVPGAVDLDLIAQGRLNLLEGFGFDLDKARIRVLLVEASQRRDVTEYLDQPTHYHLVLNVGENGVPFSDQSERLVLAWGGREVASLPIIQPAIPMCKTDEISILPHSTTFIPNHVDGDADFGGDGPEVNVTVTLASNMGDVSATIAMTAVETNDEGSTSWKKQTRAEGVLQVNLYRAPPEWTVTRIHNDLESRLEYVDSDRSEDVFEVGGIGPVRRFRIVGDTKGDEAGTRTGVTVEFNALRFTISQTDDCKPN